MAVAVAPPGPADTFATPADERIPDLVAGRYRGHATDAGPWHAVDERLQRPVLMHTAPWRPESDLVVRALLDAPPSLCAPLLDAGVDGRTAFVVFPHCNWSALASASDPTADERLLRRAMADELRAAVDAVQSVVGSCVALSNNDVLVDSDLTDPDSALTAMRWFPALRAPGRAARRRPDLDVVIAALVERRAPSDHRRFALARRHRLVPSTTPPVRAEGRTPCVSV